MLGNQKNIAIILSHKQQLKLFLPIILLANSDSRINLFCIDISAWVSEKSKVKGEEAKIFNSLGSIEYIKLPSLCSIADFLDKKKINTILIEYIGLLELKNKKEKLKIVYLQHSHDLISMFPNNIKIEQLKKIDKFLLYSDYWKAEFINAIRKNHPICDESIDQITKNIISVGFPELDQLESFEREKILKKYNLPNNKEGIVFFDPIGNVSHVGNAYFGYFFKLSGSLFNKIIIFCNQFFYDLKKNPLKILKIIRMIMKLYFSGEVRTTYEDIFLKLRKYCDDNDFLLVVKSRPKNNDPLFIKNYPDVYSHDISYFPFTLLELLYISDYYIGFNSTATLEAVACGCNVTQLDVCPREYQYFNYGGGIYTYLSKQLHTKNSWLNYQDLVKVISHRDIKDRVLSNLEFEGYKKNTTYIQKFLYKLDYKSSNRVLNVLIDYDQKK